MKIKGMREWKVLRVALALLIIGSMLFPNYAEAKSVNKITKTFILSDSSVVLFHQLSIKSDTKMKIKVQFLQVEGNVKKKSDLLFGGHGLEVKKNGKILPESYMSPFWSHFNHTLKKSSFKKGNTLTATEQTVGSGKTATATMYWQLPKGITKLKVKVTYSTTRGNKGLSFVKSWKRHESWN